MKYCEYCGSKIDDTALFCPNCGARQDKNNGGSYHGQTDNGQVPPINFDFGGQRSGAVGDDGQRSKGIAILSFMFWWVGLVLWFVWKDTKPGHAISAAKGALANACFSMPIAGLVLWFVFKKDNHEFARVCKISAIVGAAFAAALIVIEIVAASFGALETEEAAGSLVYAAIGYILK